MANRSYIPAFRANVGDWGYYICTMKYGEVARQISFAHELGGNTDLDTMIQRGLGKRTEGIRQYLLKSDHRFLGALIVAAWGGDPKYTALKIDDPEGMLDGIDEGFGVLSFDGEQQYFALDGQHRLKAIKDAIKKDPSLGGEEICVIMVSHYDTEDGRLRTRRLFSNINRNAKTTTKAENIALDEDDGPAIITRRLLQEHPFFSEDGVVKVFSSVSEGGDVKLAQASIPQGDKRAVTTISMLCEMIRSMCYDLDASMRSDPPVRPNDEVLEDSFGEISARLDDIFGKASSLIARYKAASSAVEVRSPKGAVEQGHPLMRPVVQKVVAEAVAHAATQGEDWSKIIDRLSKLSWKLNAAPWVTIFNDKTRRMKTAPEDKDLLRRFLDIHLAPSTKQAAKDARKLYKDHTGADYPVGFDDLIERMPSPS